MPRPFTSLTGKYNYTLDPKGRVFMPARFRERLGEHFIITQGNDAQCLVAMSLEEMDAMSEKLAQLPTTSGKLRDYMRRLYSGSYECETDKQGRVLLPAELRQFANLSRDVVMIGMLNQVEIWDAEAWHKHSCEIEENFSTDILPAAAEHGI
nr:division/cell wall cluster transcriptional repressor MraZ [bacterium]